MSELSRIMADLQSKFSDDSYPSEFLETYGLMECLSNHSGRETFLVRKKDTGETAVAKCYDKREFPIQPDCRFLNEISHPGLPRFFAQYQNEHTLCLVREYIEGETLTSLAQGGRLSIDRIVEIAQRLCDILDALHSHEPPVIHRDIKPENIVIRPDGSVALIDFDIARTFKEGREGDTVFFGTKGYAPPEQYGFGQTDCRADIYALGILLRWLVTGITRENLNVSFNPNLQRVISRCTAFSPEERFSSIREVRQALQSVNRHRGLSLKVLLPALAAAVLFLCAGFAVGRYTAWFAPTVKIAFSEPLIEKAARLHLGKESGTLTAEELSQVTRIYIYGTEAYGDPDLFYQQNVGASAEGPIRTLDDLALLPSLQEIHIVRQGYVDVSAIAGLSHVETVELKHMRISGVQPIAHVAALRNAILFDTGLSDVTALENCPWLETLDIGLNDIGSLKEIGSHPRLRSLGLMWLKMKDLNGIAAQLPKVQAVTLQHGSFGDLSGLRELPDLEAVYVLAEQAEAAAAALEGTDATLHVTEN